MILNGACLLIQYAHFNSTHYFVIHFKQTGLGTLIW